jgi:hypothetical protein
MVIALQYVRWQGSYIKISSRHLGSSELRRTKLSANLRGQLPALHQTPRRAVTIRPFRSYSIQLEESSD